MKYSVDSQYLDDFMENGKLTSLKVIDTHTHMGDIHGASEPIHEIDDCIKLMDHENIESIWCAPHPDLFGQNGINNIIKAIMKKYPSRVKGYFGYNPNYGEEYAGCFHEILENPNFIGFKILPAYHNYSLDGEAYIAALEFADKHSLAVLCHVWGKVSYNSRIIMLFGFEPFYGSATLLWLYCLERVRGKLFQRLPRVFPGDIMA